MKLFTHVFLLCIMTLFAGSCAEETPITQVDQEVPSPAVQSVDRETARYLLYMISNTDEHTWKTINTVAKVHGFRFDMSRVQKLTNLGTNVQIISFPTDSPYTLSVFLTKPYERGGDLHLASAIYTEITVDNDLNTINYLSFDDKKFLTLVSEDNKLVSVEEFDVPVAKNPRCNWWCYFNRCADQFVQLITGGLGGSLDLDSVAILACIYDGPLCAIAGLAGCSGWATSMVLSPRQYECCDYGSMPTPPGMNY